MYQFTSDFRLIQSLDAPGNECVSVCLYHVPFAFNNIEFNPDYSGTSLLRSPTGLGKRDLNGEVTLLQGVICTVESNLGLSQGDYNWEVFLLVR